MAMPLRLSQRGPDRRFFSRRRLSRNPTGTVQLTKATKVKPHRAIRKTCRWCKVWHSRSKHAGHGFGAYLRTHRRARLAASMPTAQQVFNALLEDEAKRRLEEMVTMHQAGAVEMTGRTKVVDDKVVGRFGGRFSDLFPELAAFDRTPAALIRSIRSPRHTALQAALHGAVLDFIEEQHGDDILTWMDQHPADAIEFYQERAA